MTVVTKGLVKFSEEMFVMKYRTHTINMYRLFENITKTNEQGMTPWEYMDVGYSKSLITGDE